MNFKQLRIFHKICDNFKIYGKKKFIQYRNLTEFKEFQIEKINPNHKILLLGKLRREKVLDKNYDKFITVGYIIIYSAFLIFPFNNLTIYLTNSIIIYLLYFKAILNNKIEKEFKDFLRFAKKQKINFYPLRF